MRVRSAFGAIMVLSLFFSVTSPGDALSKPRFSLDPSNRRVTSVSNLFSQTDCRPTTSMTGRVVARQFDSLGVKLSGVTFEAPSGRRTFVNVDEYPENLSANEIGWLNEGLNTILRQGARASVVLRLCGAAGRMMFLDAARPAR